MSTGFAWARLLVILPILAGGVARAELPSGDSAAFHERMSAWSTQPVEPAAERPAPRSTVVALELPRLSSRYGARRDPVDGGRRFHAGIDIPGATGSPVLASAGGVVSFAGSAGGYGRMIEIDHGGGLRTRYAHLARLLVAAGTPVAQGAVVGRMGSTGRSTGTHLHFEVRRDGRPVDPVAYLSRAALRPLAAAPHWQTVEPHISGFARARAQADVTVAAN